MQNFKNFKLSRATEKDFKKFGEEIMAIEFFEDEDGNSWSECQELFADNTIKIMYDRNDVIVCVVDKPVPQRGNTYAVSVFYPLGLSVAEVEALPPGFKVGAFKFDGKNITAIPAPVQHKSTETQELWKEIAELKKLVAKK